VKYASLCPKCGLYQSKVADCPNECARRGFVTLPRMVNVRGRENEICQHAEVNPYETTFVVGIPVAGSPRASALGHRCGNEVQQMKERAR